MSATTQPSTVAPTPEAVAFLRLVEETLPMLYTRWLDEHEYENINDYLLPLKSLAKKANVVLIGMTKRPFGVKFSVGAKVFHLTTSLTRIGYKRLK